VDKDTYLQSTESMQADYSTVMPFLVAALLQNRKRYEQRAAEIGAEQLYQEEPKARGYLRARGGYRLFENRGELCRRLNEDVKANQEWLLDTLAYPLAQ
jgi:deoxyhypusine synthase